MEKRSIDDEKSSDHADWRDLLDAAVDGRVLGTSDIEQAIVIVETGAAHAHLSKFFSATLDGRLPDKLTRAVGLVAFDLAMRTAAGRKAAGLPPRGRGKHWKFDASVYGIGSIPETIARDSLSGKVSRPQARMALAEHIGDANTKTLDRLLDDLRERVSLLLLIEKNLPPK